MTRRLDDLIGCERLINTVNRMKDEDEDLAIYVSVKQRPVAVRVVRVTEEQAAEIERLLGIE